MNTFNWVKAFAYGIVIWLVMFAFISALIGFNFYGNVWMQLLTAVVAMVLTYAFASNLHSATLGDALGYGSLFVIMGIFLDVAVTARFSTDIFSQWTYWLSYAVILLTPALKVEAGYTASVR